MYTQQGEGGGYISYIGVWYAKGFSEETIFFIFVMYLMSSTIKLKPEI